MTALSMGAYRRPNLDLPQAARELLAKGIATIPSGVPERFSTIEKGMLQLWRNPKDQPPFVINHPRELDPQGELDHGLVFRDGGEKKIIRPEEVNEGRQRYDARKCFMHVKASSLGYWRRQGADIDAYRDMIDGFEAVRGELMLTCLDLAEILDTLMPNIGFLQRMRQFEFWTPVRFLIYPCDADSTDILAQGHYDKCFLTIHVEANRKGYWYVDRSGRPRLMHGVGGEQITMFLGQEAEKITLGKLRPVFHGVVDELGKGSCEVRTSMVFFCRAMPKEPEERWFSHIANIAPKPKLDIEEVRSLFRT